MAHIRLRVPNIAFFSGNSVYWIILLQPSGDGRQYRIVETHKKANPIEDPNPWLWQNCANPPYSPGRFNAPRCDANDQSEQTLVGSITSDGSFNRGDAVFTATVTNDLSMWPLQGSGLRDGSRLPGMIGYEAQTVCGLDQVQYADCSPKQSRRPTPPSQKIVAHSPFRVGPLPLHNLYTDMSLYPVGSTGAWVLSTGSTDWSLGLDIYTPLIYESTDYYRVHPAIVHITKKVLKQFGDPRDVADLPVTANYTLTVTSIQPGQTGTATACLQYTAPAGRPTTDFIALHDVTQTEEDLFHWRSDQCNSLGTQGKCCISAAVGHDYTYAFGGSRG